MKNADFKSVDETVGRDLQMTNPCETQLMVRGVQENTNIPKYTYIAL